MGREDSQEAVDEDANESLDEGGPNETDTDGEGDDSPEGEAGDDSGQNGIEGAVTRFRQLSRKQQVLRAGTAITIFGFIVLLAVVPMGILGLAVTDSATFSADPAAPDDEMLADLEYEQTGADTVVVEQRISPAGQQRTIRVRNKRRTYTKTVQVQNGTFDAGVFVTLSSPSIQIAGTERNPLAKLSHRELLQRFQSDLDASNGSATFERVGERKAVMLGQPTTASEFRTTLTVEGEQQEFAVYVATVRSEGDIVVAVGLHPVAFGQERMSIMQLVYSIKHPA